MQHCGWEGLSEFHRDAVERADGATMLAFAYVTIVLLMLLLFEQLWSYTHQCWAYITDTQEKRESQKAQHYIYIFSLGSKNHINTSQYISSKTSQDRFVVN